MSAKLNFNRSLLSCQKLPKQRMPDWIQFFDSKPKAGFKKRNYKDLAFIANKSTKLQAAAFKSSSRNNLKHRIPFVLKMCCNKTCNTRNRFSEHFLSLNYKLHIPLVWWYQTSFWLQDINCNMGNLETCLSAWFADTFSTRRTGISSLSTCFLNVYQCLLVVALCIVQETYMTDSPLRHHLRCKRHQISYLTTFRYFKPQPNCRKILPFGLHLRSIVGAFWYPIIYFRRQMISGTSPISPERGICSSS